LCKWGPIFKHIFVFFSVQLLTFFKHFFFFLPKPTGAARPQAAAARGLPHRLPH
jgi:hypothetical protein